MKQPGLAKAVYEITEWRSVEWFTANGVLDTSMRTLAAGIGTSNRMLNYHFGCREQRLAVVIERVL